jgi:DNA ligase-1
MRALVEGSPVYIKGSGAKPDELKNVGGVYSCTCPAWRNQSAPIDKRTCKHLKAHCGDAAETARIGGVSIQPALGTAPTPATVCNTTKVPLMEVIAEVTDQRERQAEAKEAPQTVNGRVVTADAAYAQTILDRAAKDGRKLRQDEKTKLHGPPILLAHKYEDFPDLDPTGWWYSEKLDGVRAYWDGKNFVSRQGNIFHAPDWFKAALPDEILDGELWMGREMFQKTISVVKRLDWGEGAKSIKYVIFDVPGRKDEIFEARLNAAINHALAANAPHVKAHPHHAVQSRKHLADELKAVAALGGEGLMIRKPKSLYEAGRSSTLLKVKPWEDAEAVVVGYEAGKGRHKGVVGGLLVRTPEGKEFNLGTGLSDEERRNPPKVGSTVTYSFTGKTEAGIPKCAAYLCVRDYE